MKTTFQAILIFFAISLTSCPKDTAFQTLGDLTTERLSTTWILAAGTSVTHNGTDITQDYAGFEITFDSDGTYTTINGPAAFNNSGTWHFSESNLTIIVRDGEIAMTSVLTETTLRLQFSISETQLGSRTSTLIGEYIFDLAKKN